MIWPCWRGRWGRETGSLDNQTAFAYTWVWLLLLGGLVHVLDFRRGRRTTRRLGGRDTSSDAYRLRTLTLLPVWLWSTFFLTATLAALVVGGGILLGYFQPVG